MQERLPPVWPAPAWTMYSEDLPPILDRLQPKFVVGQDRARCQSLWQSPCFLARSPFNNRSRTRRWAASASCRSWATLSTSESRRSSTRLSARIVRMLLAGGLHWVLAEGKLVEQDGPLPVDLAQGVEKLQRLDQVYRADSHIVVPLAPVVVDLDADQLAAARHQVQHIGRGLLGEQGVAQIEDDADVVRRPCPRWPAAYGRPC